MYLLDQMRYTGNFKVDSISSFWDIKETIDEKIKNI